MSMWHAILNILSYDMQVYVDISFYLNQIYFKQTHCPSRIVFSSKEDTAEQYHGNFMLQIFHLQFA